MSGMSLGMDRFLFHFILIQCHLHLPAKYIKHIPERVDLAGEKCVSRDQTRYIFCLAIFSIIGTMFTFLHAVPLMYSCSFTLQRQGWKSWRFYFILFSYRVVVSVHTWY